MNGFTDSHIHMADPGFGAGYAEIGSCPLLLSCTSRPAEWPVQTELCGKNAKIFPFFGTHPWHAAEHDGPGLEEILDGREDAGVGEIGLDALRGYPKLQAVTFQRQLSIAEEYGRPVTVHMVGTEKMTLDALKGVDVPGVILHSFDSGSYAKPFSALGCYFSLSPRVLMKSDRRISALLGSLPLDRLLIESDFPGCRGSIEGLILKVSGMLSMDAEELMKLTGRNARSVIS